jgi:two-component system, cell cycle sensor histidine kinase and response regulator CckA
MGEPLNLLQVEDSESDAELIVRLLKKAGYAVNAERVEDREAMRAALASREWDVIITDHRMAQFDAPGALRVLHESGQDIPIIVVSGSIGEELAVSMMKAGAHDYVIKTNLIRLPPAVEREIKEARARREQKKAQQALLESEERLAMAIDATQMGTFDFDPQTGKLIWSDLNKRHFGLPPEAEVGDPVFLRGLHDDDRERVQALVDYAMKPESGGKYAAEYRVRGIEDGVERRLAAWGRVYFDARGRPVRFVGVTLDITERVRLEEQFRQAQKLESVGRLAGGVAHDFNNLLTVISGYAQMTLAEIPAQHPLRAGIEEISDAADRAASLTRQLLTFSRRHQSEAKTIAVNDLLRDFHRMLDRLIGEDIELKLDLHPDAGGFRADPGGIEQIVMNLAVNAKDAMPSGGKLRIETGPFTVDEQYARDHPPLAPGRHVMLSVSDSGSGMAPEVRARIFEPFFTTKELGKGTGLGLSTVYGIVTQCGGAISVDSEPGHGTTFRMLFPATDGKTMRAAVRPEEPAPSGKETILVVEDEPGVRKYIREILRSHGYTVLESSNGRAALELVGENRAQIDLLMADAVMPEMGGLELSRHFAEIRPGVPVLFVSGYSGESWPEAGAMTSYLQKPFAPPALLSRVRTLLDARQDRAAGAASGRRSGDGS